MTLKYGQGYWKRYEEVKLSERYHHAKTDVYHIYGVGENPNVSIFNQSMLDQPKTVYYLPWIHIWVTQLILCMIFSCMEPYNTSTTVDKNLKKHKLQFCVWHTCELETT